MGSERNTNEVSEAVMIHTKTVKTDQTGLYSKRCMYNYTRKWQGCYVGFSWPIVDENQIMEADMNHITKAYQDTHDGKNYRESDGMEYNCFINPNVEHIWIPKLEQALEERRKEYQ